MSPTAETIAHARLRSQLWTDAYDRLEREEARLVDAYERILSLHLHEHARATATIESPDNDIKKMAPEERQLFLQDIIETTFKRSKSGAPAEQRVDNSKENLDFVKQIIDSIAVAGGELPFAWVGVCLALKFLLKPVTPQGFDRETAAFLISRMNLYWNMSTFITSYSRKSPDSRTRELIKLYTRALSCQMKIIYAYYQQEESLFLQDLPSVGDWEDIMDDLHKREHNILLFQYIFRDRTTWEIVHHLRGFANMATSDETKLRDMHLGDVPTVCTACGNLDPRIWGTNNYLTYVVDVQHASSECSACMVIIRGFSAIVKPLEGIAQLTLSVRKEASLRVRCRWKTYASWDSRYLEFYVQQDCPRPWPAIRPGRSLQSSICMELISKWFHRCLTEDLMCRVRESTLPARVVCIDGESREPFLYETRREEASSTALSHCWGAIRDIHLTTTRASLKDRMDSIPVATLPKTFADAVLLTRKLGIKYIWIDSLCIIQGDPEDWVRESARMAEVYQNAVLTISADGAADGSQGLFQITTLPICEVSIPFQSPSGSGLICARETTLDGEGDHVHIIGHKQNEPLRHRGWALQEWLLSNRIVHFTTDELLWECKALQFCQCQVTSQSSTEWEEQMQGQWYRGLYYKKGKGDRGGGYLEWPQVVRDFTKRQLTIQTDTLPALSGLAAFNKSNAAEDYIAGLWKSELPDAMLWQVSSEKSERYEDYYAPSWSWASTKGTIDFPHLYGYNKLPLKCKVLKLSAVPATNNPFGPLKSGFIEIKGLVGILSINMERETTRLMFNYEREGIRHCGNIVLDGKGLASEGISADEIPFLIVYRNTVNADETYGIALKRLKDEGQFMRISLVTIIYIGKNWQSWIQNDLKAKKQIVTIV